MSREGRPDLISSEMTISQTDDKSFFSTSCTHQKTVIMKSSRQTRFATMVDALYWACVLWERNRRKELAEHLSQTYGANEIFWRVAQPISEVLPGGDKEKGSPPGPPLQPRVYNGETTTFLYEEG